MHAWDTVAVRSSAVGEDGAVSSGAGAYETVLSVPADDVDAMTEAVDAVLASIGESGAVIVQQMVMADAAGVTFTVDPVTGAPVVVVNAVAGLGAALVSGAATPWVCAVDRGERTARSDPEALDADGGPLDAEPRCARSSASRSLAEQARGGRRTSSGPSRTARCGSCSHGPVTALAEQIPVEIVVPPGYWVRDPTHGRLPRTRMTSSVVDEDRRACAR